MPKLQINRNFNYSFGILSVETTEGGCNENILEHSIESLEKAILKMDDYEEDGNTSLYIIVDFNETKIDKPTKRRK